MGIIEGGGLKELCVKAPGRMPGNIVGPWEVAFALQLSFLVQGGQVLSFG